MEKMYLITESQKNAMVTFLCSLKEVRVEGPVGEAPPEKKAEEAVVVEEKKD